MRSSVLAFLLGLLMMAVIPSTASAQQDTTVQAADSVSQQDTVPAVPTDPAVQPDTAQAAPVDSAETGRSRSPNDQQPPSGPDSTGQSTADAATPDDTTAVANTASAADTSQVPADSLAGRDSTAQTAVDSVGHAPDSAAVSGAVEVDTAATAQPPPPPPVTYDDSQLQTIAQVLVAIEELRQKYHSRQGLPEDSLAGGLGLHAQFQAEVARLVEEHGITMEFYNEVIQQARERPALRKQLLEHAAAVRE